VFSVLKDSNYKRWLTIESFGFALGDLCSAASIWRDLASTPDQIAWEGIEFLKGATDGRAQAQKTAI
jgi:D-psicose/D-tagatose/L-ribulose 3-epimerase